jgi:glycosyltransferase involved in cell wall biosynthesis
MKPLKGMRFSPLGRNTTIRLWQRYDFPPLEWWVRNISVVHSLELSYPVSTRNPWVVTIHDVGPLTHPHFFVGNKPEVMDFALNSAVTKADALLCVSQTTAGSLQEYVQRDLSDRIRVIPEGVSDFFFEEGDASTQSEINALLPENVPYFLFTGAASPRKNLSRMIQAFEVVAAEIPHHLVMTGKLAWDFQHLVETLERSLYKDRIHRLGFQSEENLRALYQRADLFLYLSLMEGFGLTIIEAMASGCPVLTSNISSMPEIAGGAAALVDPYDVDAIAQGMKKIALDRQYADALRAEGRARAKQLSWRLCAQRTAQVYREVAG